MTSLYEDVIGLPGVGRAVAATRLRRNIMELLHTALQASGLTQVELARQLRVRKSAVNRVLQGDGNLQINTVAEYLYELGSELRVEALPFGTQRAEVVGEISEHHAQAVAHSITVGLIGLSAAGILNSNVTRMDWQGGASAEILHALATAA